MHKRMGCLKNGRKQQVLEIRSWEANLVDKFEDRVEEIFQKLRQKHKEVEI